MSHQPFKKRIFTSRSLLGSGFHLLKYLPTLIRAYFFNGFDTRFAERLLLVVSGVNGCAYCSWFHSLIAARRGLSNVEIGKLLNQLIPGDIPVYEQPALEFAIHFAESDGKPDAIEIRDLYRQFPVSDVRAILALCHAIHFGNLCGNTYDAFLYRLKGKPAENSHVLLEFSVFLISAPFLLPLMGRI